MTNLRRKGVRLTIPGKPFGKQRHRSTKQGHTYTPTKTVNYETQIKERFAACYPGFAPMEGPLLIDIRAYFPIPKSTSKKQAELMRRGEVFPTKKPDFDNISKVVGDALNALAYRDDCQVVSARVDKLYGDVPHVDITIYPIQKETV